MRSEKPPRIRVNLVVTSCLGLITQYPAFVVLKVGPKTLDNKTLERAPGARFCVATVFEYTFVIAALKRLIWLTASVAGAQRRRADLLRAASQAGHCSILFATGLFKSEQGEDTGYDGATLNSPAKLR